VGSDKLNEQLVEKNKEILRLKDRIYDFERHQAGFEEVQNKVE